MNKLKGSLLAAALCFTGAACLFIASCGDKNSIEYVFETNGGEAIENVTLEPGEQYTLPIPEREGYSFEGWYLTSDFSGEPVETVSAETESDLLCKMGADVSYHVGLERRNPFDVSSFSLFEGGGKYL